MSDEPDNLLFGTLLNPQSMAKLLQEFARTVIMCQKMSHEQRRLANETRGAPGPESTTEVVYRAQLRNFYNSLKEMNVNFESEVEEEMARMEALDTINARNDRMHMTEDTPEMGTPEKKVRPEMDRSSEKDGMTVKEGTPEMDGRPETEKTPVKEGTPEKNERPEKDGTPGRPEMEGTPGRPEMEGTPKALEMEGAQEAASLCDICAQAKPRESRKRPHEDEFDLNDMSAVELLLTSLNAEPNHEFEFAYKVLDDLDTIDKN